MSKIKIRPLGHILLELEPLLIEMVDQHDLQWSDILGLIHNYLMVHCPEAQEEYTDGTRPIFYYGPNQDSM